MGSSLREAFIICLNFQCSHIKMEKKKLEAEVIKLIVKFILKELWGAESHVAFFFFFQEFSFCCFLSSDFKGFSKERLVLFLTYRPSQSSCVGFVSPGVSCPASLSSSPLPQNLPHTRVSICVTNGAVSHYLPILVWVKSKDCEYLSILVLPLSKEAENKFIAFYVFES